MGSSQQKSNRQMPLILSAYASLPGIRRPTCFSGRAVIDLADLRNQNLPHKYLRNCIFNLNLNLSVDGRATLRGVWCPFPCYIDRRYSWNYWLFLRWQIVPVTDDRLFGWRNFVLVPTLITLSSISFHVLAVCNVGRQFFLKKRSLSMFSFPGIIL